MWIAMMADDAAELLNALDISSAHVMGFSGGSLSEQEPDGPGLRVVDPSADRTKARGVTCHRHREQRDRATARPRPEMGDEWPLSQRASALERWHDGHGRQPARHRALPLRRRPWRDAELVAARGTHNWSVTLTTAEAQQRLGPLVLGELTDMRVTARNSSGRVATVEITGSGGITTATGVQMRTALRLRSTWFDIRLD